MSLAYIFWHSRKTEVKEQDYESALDAFHKVLREHPSPGLVRSRVFKMGSTPWLSSMNSIYEDWYILQDSSAIDPLNEAAVTFARQSSHDAVATLADSGTAGLYKLRAGNPDGIVPSIALWFPKPEGESYPAFFKRVEGLMPASSVLWGRQMTLGPTPEFCLHLTKEDAVPSLSKALRIELEPLFLAKDKS
jgi:hypothetical protein